MVRLGFGIPSSSSKANSWNGELSWFEAKREDFQLPKAEVKLNGITGM
jgi:hypothetical protein